MADKKKRKKTYPVCQEHFNRIRDEALSGMPFWTRLLARLRAKSEMNRKGFVLSKTECRFCGSDSGDK